MSDDLSALGNFDGSVCLFPLPNLVMFPYVIQPLHVFEPRYRRMTADALAGDRLLAVVLLRPGWEDDYEGRPPVHPIACVGKIVADQRLDDGRYNLLLRGLRRVRILGEAPPQLPYRTARVELLADRGSLGPADEAALRRHLGEQVPRWLPAETAALDQFRKLLDSDLSPGALCDIFAFALPLEAEAKQELLEELDVAERARRLTELLLAQVPAPEAVASDRKFPPDFSAN
jgi:Lon protease-like protein